MIDHNKRNSLMSAMLEQDGLKASVYLPTHRAFPDNKQDPIVYKNLLQELEKELTDKHPRRDWQGMMGKLYALLDDTDLWNHTTAGLGVLANGQSTETFLLDKPTGPAWYLGDTYHLLPLYPLMDSISHAYLTDISRDRFRMFEVSQDGLRELELPEIKNTFPELFDDFDPNSNLRTGSYQGLSGAFHGHGGRAEEADKDMDKYFRYLDNNFQALNRDSGYPMILAGTADSITEFRQLAKGNFYLDHAITQPLESLDLRDAMEEIKTALRPHLTAQTEKINTLISNKRKENKAVSDLAAIREAAAQGRIETLILPDELQESEQAHLDLAASQTLQNGGTLYQDQEDLLQLPLGRVALLRY